MLGVVRRACVARQSAEPGAAARPAGEGRKHVDKIYNLMLHLFLLLSTSLLKFLWADI